MKNHRFLLCLGTLSLFVHNLSAHPEGTRNSEISSPVEFVTQEAPIATESPTPDVQTPVATENAPLETAAPLVIEIPPASETPVATENPSFEPQMPVAIEKASAEPETPLTVTAPTSEVQTPVATEQPLLPTPALHHSLDTPSFATSSANGAEDAMTAQKPKTHGHKSDCCCAQCKCPNNEPLYGYFQMKKNTLGVFGEFLLWKSTITNLSPVMTAQNASVTGLTGVVPTNVHKKYVNFHYDPGVRATIAYTSLQDQWDWAITWTYYNAEQTDRFPLKANQFYLIPNTSAGLIRSAASASAKEKVQLNMLDFALSKMMFFSKPFVTRPSIGIRAVQLTNEMKATYSQATPNSSQLGFPALVTDTLTNKTIYEGIGLRGALASEWNGSWGFGMYGNFGMSLLWGPFKPSHTENIRSAIPGISFNNTFSSSAMQHALKSALDLAAGFQWQIAFRDSKARFKLCGGYEFGYWFNQVNASTFVPETALNTSGASGIDSLVVGDVGYQGFTVGAEFDF